MAKQKLTDAQIAGALLDQRDLHSAETVSSVERRIQPDQRHPGVDEPTVLARSDMIARPGAAREERVFLTRTSLSKPGCKRFPGCVRQFEWYRPPSLLLNNRGSETNSASEDVIPDPKANEIATAQLAVDC